MKLGILGTGMIVKDMLTGISDLDFESVYILGTDETKDETEGLKEKYALNRTYYDYEEIQCLQCLAYGLMAASRVYYVDETVGEENEATGQAYIAATETIGLVLGSALGGLIMQNLGLETLLVVGAVACAAGASFMLLSNLKK